MVKAARLVLESGVCLLPSICFQKIIPFCTLPYTKCKAQIATDAAITVWNSNTKRSEVQLLELVEDVDYLKVIHGLSAKQKTPEPSEPSQHN